MNNSKTQKIMAFINNEKFNTLLSAPSFLLLLFIIIKWVFYYSGIISVIFDLVVVVLSPLCIITFVWQLIRKKIKQCAFIILTIAVAWFMVFPHSNKVIPCLRHYVEFLIQKNIYIHEMNEINKDTKYKIWDVEENEDHIYRIIYDPSDETAKEDYTYRMKTINGKEIPTNYYYIYKLGNHFYMREEVLAYD